MNNSFIDLHMHTLYSDDGQYSPEELMAMAGRSGVEIIAIADHDTVKGVKAARTAAQKAGMTFISGVEIDCQYQNLGLHVLGYGIDEDDPVFEQIGRQINQQELANSETKIKLTEKLGFEVDRSQLDSLSKNGVYTGEMFAEVLLNDPRYTANKLLAPYRSGGSRSDNPYVNFFWDYYSAGKPCETALVLRPLEEITAAIKKAGGVSVLAHPGNNLKADFGIFDSMVKAGLQGVEVFSSYHTPQTCSYFLAKARQYNLLITCGSDFHGKTKPAIKLGQTGCTIDENEIKAQLIQCGLLS